jgi:hypothetical protein
MHIADNLPCRPGFAQGRAWTASGNGMGELPWGMRVALPRCVVGTASPCLPPARCVPSRPGREVAGSSAVALCNLGSVGCVGAGGT